LEANLEIIERNSLIHACLIGDMICFLDKKVDDLICLFAIFKDITGPTTTAKIATKSDITDNVIVSIFHVICICSTH
jgi:hypothetical protein